MRSVLRPVVIAVAGAVGAALAGPAGLALAQSAGGNGASDFPDLVPVAIWTGVAIVLALLLTSVGYLYRRQRGLDHPLRPPPIDANLDHDHGTVDPLEPTAGHAVTPHALIEHTGTGASDAVEQAAAAHDRPH